MSSAHPSGTAVLQAIAYIRNDFPTKFGLPRQSGLIDTLEADIVFEPAYRNPSALRGLEGFSHVWLVWGFSQAVRTAWSPTVRPPRLGGNTRMGVFATRSPYRPNPIGLSCVKLVSITSDSPKGPILRVCGADLMDGTPIWDIKPYLPYADSQPNATGGFTDQQRFHQLDVVFPADLLSKIPAYKRNTLTSVLQGDPRPAYQEDPERTYGFLYAGFDVRFRVAHGTLTVLEIVPVDGK